MTERPANAYRALPSVDRLLQVAALRTSGYPPSLLTALTREELTNARLLVANGQPAATVEQLAASILARLSSLSEPTLRPVINASGVIIHTNLGRAPLSAEAIAAMAAVSSGYSNLEYDLRQGARGSRHDHVAALLCQLSGGEDGIVVNNNAAALVLVLSALAKGKEVLVSRGQAVEIGGGFRIPDVMRQSGAKLVDVGTTNRTRASDYGAAVSTRTAALLNVHSSNFRMIGFTEQPTLAELVAVAKGSGILAMDDLGSGSFLASEQFGLAHEPQVEESVAAGMDVITFSGDKLLGGPQAGIIVGKREPMARIRKHPLVRAIRVDKTILAGVQATLLHYLRGEALQKIPVWRMISQSASEMRERATSLQAQLAHAGVACVLQGGQSAVGGGSLPGETLPTTLIALSPRSAERLAARLREGNPAVVARIEEGKLLLDPRTVQPGEGDLLVRQVAAAWHGLEKKGD